ncbi:MAG: energy-coupling factor ABC transporter permease [Rhodospirillales bacterium]|jgi:ABC-type Co2+ transport system permease subunit
MHIEPGYIDAARVAGANVAAVGVVAWYAKDQVKEGLKAAPMAMAKTAAAATFFSLFMQSFHMPVGPSELHFVGAMAMYLTLGFTPTLLGFGLGLLFQGLLFEPQDLVHLGVNSLSLIVPLIAVHQVAGKKFFAGALGQRLSWARIVKLDAMYYSGVTAMVGFWLLLGNEETAFSSWLAFASSYLVLVAIEPLVTWLAVNGLKKAEDTALVKHLFVVNQLKLAD